MKSRKRHDEANGRDGTLDKGESSSKDNKNHKFHNSFSIWGFYVAVNLLIYFFVYLRLLHSFPNVIRKGDKDFSERFSEEQAREHLNAIIGFGPRVSGSHENEVETVNYLLNEIGKIKAQVDDSKDVIVDVQTVSGSFHLQNIIKTNYYSVYEGLQNIVVKVTSNMTRKDSLLINCHFDTVPNSPGAGDNAVSCAVMLDVLRVFSHSQKPLLHDIIFLFNGAEENILQASHGFITQHKWKESVKAFVNLDSAGAGGWELVFQTGPEHPWLVTAYAESAPYPFGTVIGQELFQTGLIPSDTDFRIFRDFGNIPGIDIAHVSNGYIYHTKNDKPKFIPDGCLQRAGENILALMTNIASSPKLADPGVDRHGEMVFFDVVGLFMVHYPKRIGTVINSVVVALAFFYIIKKSRAYDGNSTLYIKNLMLAIQASLASWLVTIVTEVAIAIVMSKTGYSMFWFTNTFNIFSVFVVSALSSVLGQTWSYLLVTGLGVVIPLLITMLPFHVTCLLFVPIMGRSGTDIIPDIPISLFATIMVLLSSQFCISAVYISINLKSLLRVLWGTAAVAILVVVLTPLGFPFHANVDAPTLKRAIIVHTDRNFFNIEGNVRYEDSGIWYLPFDITHKRLMSSPFIEKSNFATCNGPYCGLPYLIPVAHLINPRNTFWYDTTKAFPKPKVKFSLTRKQNVLPEVIRLTFTLDGPDHMSMYICPRTGVDLVKWSLDRATPVPTSSSTHPNETVYWVYYAYGIKPVKPYQFFLDLKVPKNYDSQSVILDLAVTSHILHGNDQISPQLSEYLASLPDYVAPSAWYGSYDWYQY
ncbi:hypothetical protein FSP39_013471 [Pinctada imbricata]|uniref:Endoplasmic reticulum metallopeptidase 1 n=1 Tax=Pinctada imbricata TaxID=66713 RepID=A0AA88XYQ1_PINIB|nr:hypothetical protein FSP39_013471 [Pinctada imbricata]